MPLGSRIAALLRGRALRAELAQAAAEADHVELTQAAAIAGNVGAESCWSAPIPRRRDSPARVEPPAGLVAWDEPPRFLRGDGSYTRRVRNHANPDQWIDIRVPGEVRVQEPPRAEYRMADLPADHPLRRTEEVTRQAALAILRGDFQLAGGGYVLSQDFIGGATMRLEVQVELPGERHEGVFDVEDPAAPRFLSGSVTFEARTVEHYSSRLGMRVRDQVYVVQEASQYHWNGEDTERWQQAQARARALLLRFLTAEQKKSLDEEGWILHRGKRRNYRLRLGGGAERFDSRRLERLCVDAVGGGNVPSEDRLLALLLHLRNDEGEFNRTANSMGQLDLQEFPDYAATLNLA